MSCEHIGSVVIYARAQVLIDVVYTNKMLFWKGRGETEEIFYIYWKNYSALEWF